MYKLITYAGYDNKFGPHIFPIEPDLDRSISHIKMARELPPQIEGYLRNAAPIPGKTQLLIDAMGSSDYYGQNVNGDAFPTEALDHKGPDYGYETFMHYAYPYKFHVNKDVARAYGDKVTLADYDRTMHRVLLIVCVDDRKCADILSDLENNKYWDVSMGCFTGETLVTMSDGTRKPIAEIGIGDSVITHLGRSRRVKEIHRRPYKGDLYTIRAEAHEPICCTRQHPFRAIEKTDIISNPGSSHRRWKQDLSVRGAWVHAECLDDHLLMEPVLGETLTPDYADRSFARLLGYYLAEGHVLRNKNKEIVGLELSVHRDDAVHDEIFVLCREFGTKNDPVTRDHGLSEFGRQISIFDERLALLCFEHAGAYAKKKRLSPEAMRWHPEMQRELIGAFANGDGCGTPDGSLKLSTSSTDLAWQMTVLLPRIGIIPSLHSLTHKAGSGFSHHVTNEWVIHIGKQYAQTLRNVCAKIVPAEIYKSKHSRRIAVDADECEQVLCPIREINAMYVEIEVFNLEVEEDESFVAGGLAVHNCRVPWDECTICRNRARNRSEYCPDLRYQMNKILPDGRRVGAINRLPKFFDISFVPIGAEKASHVLAKVAGAVPVYDIRTTPSAEAGEIYYAKLANAEKASSEQKAAEITKNIPTSDVKVEGVTPEDRAKMTGFMDDAKQVKDQEAPIPNPVLDALGSFPLKDVFATLTALGIDLRPQEFQRIILVKQGARALAEKLAQHHLVFDAARPGNKAPAWASDLAALTVHDANEKIAMILRPYIIERSCYPDILLARLDRMEKRADLLLDQAAGKGQYNPNSQWYPMTDDAKRLSSGVPGLIPASIALAAGFMVFKNSFPQLIEKFPSPIRALAAHPWMLPLLIGAGVGASVGLSTMTASRPLSPNGTGTGLDGKRGTTYHQPKTAGVDPVRFGPIALAYIQSGAQQQMNRSIFTKHAASQHGAIDDDSIYQSVRRLARRRKESRDANAR